MELQDFNPGNCEKQGIEPRSESGACGKIGIRIHGLGKTGIWKKLENRECNFWILDTPMKRVYIIPVPGRFRYYRTDIYYCIREEDAVSLHLPKIHVTLVNTTNS
jgi:hypothetical protein